MPPSFAVICPLLCALLLLLPTSAAAASNASQYPLLHIGDKLKCVHTGAACIKDNGTDGNGYGFQWGLTDADAAALAAYSLLHVSFEDASQVAKLHKFGGGPNVKYTETRPVCGGSSGQVTPFSVDCNSTLNFETGGFRRDARVYLAAHLESAITRDDTTLIACLVPKSDGTGVVSPLVASTAKGNFSDYDGTTYVFFIRLRDELLKVTSATTTTPRTGQSSCQHLRVQRGLDGTTPGAYPAAEPVLAPAFVRGLAKDSGAQPFIAEYTSFYAWSSLANFTVDAVVQQGVDGAWFDSFSPSTWEEDVGGVAVPVWDVATGAPLTAAGAVAGQVARLNAVWTDVLARLPRPPVIWANNFETWFDYNDTEGSLVPGDHVFVVPTLAKSAGLLRPFDGASLESWLVAFQGGCWPQNGYATAAYVYYFPESDWQLRVDTLLDIGAQNVSVAAMLGSAGCQSGVQVYLNNRAQLDAFHYASYLLGVAAEGGTPTAAAGPLLGTSAFYAPSTAGAGAWPVGLAAAALNPLFTLPLGAPLDFVTDSTGYQIAPAVYARHFEQALVLVNPTPARARAPTQLNGTYFDVTSDTPTAPLTQVVMEANSGRVLLKQPAAA